MAVPTPGDTVIAVMGITGVGKSTFIANATGQDVRIGHGLTSCTEELEIFEGEINGSRVFFIDTPGFDDSGLRDDADILEMIAQKLQEISTNNIQLTSILFLHKITDNRFTGSNKRLQRVFAKVCGHDAFRSVVLATTMWDELREESVGARRERDLTEGDFWGKMVRGGTDCVRLYNSQESANWLAELLTAKTPTTLQMQTELQNEQGFVMRTSAGRELDRIYTERIQPREEKERSKKLNRKERDELERLQASQYRLRYTIITIVHRSSACTIL